MRRFLDSLFAPSRRDGSDIQKINAMRAGFACLTDDQLRAAAARTGSINKSSTPKKDLLTVIAITAAIASRVLGLDMFDVQLRGTLALARGSIAEMQTGEGKTLAAVPAIAWFARQGNGVHVMTVNDYLARRDAAWMGEIYKFLGLTVAHVQQGMTAAERRTAYACDITYATANEIGFDFLRDRLALRLEDQVHRPFAAAVIDEADSILIDEARIPLVIAGGDSGDSPWAYVADPVVRNFRIPVHCTIDVGSRNVALTDAGIAAVESSFGCGNLGNLYDERNFDLLTAVQDSLHAHILLRRDVDYVVKNGSIEMVDEFKGRIAQDRRWPAGLHTAGSMTLTHLVRLYPRVCGMTGTAATQALEFQQVYEMPVEVIPTNRPMIRADHPDEIFATKAGKEAAVLAEIRRLHHKGQPVLVGTGSVEESERLSRKLGDIPHNVLNARNDEREAAIIAQAGDLGAVTISTNMAGRGTDIRLGHGAAEAGGLYVIGTQKHESRRIDNQLRGRSGRQGDPGDSRFFLSFEDDLLVKFGDLNPELGRDPDTVQRLVEGHHLDARLFLQKYELPIEGQRYRVHAHRQSVLEGTTPCESELEKLVTLRAIDDLWADYLARVAEFRSSIPWLDFALGGVPWLTLDRRDPLYEYAQKIHQWFPEMQAALPGEIARRLAEAESGAVDPGERGAVWTYLTTDQPFGSFSQRLSRGIARKFKRRA